MIEYLVFGGMALVGLLIIIFARKESREMGVTKTK